MSHVEFDYLTECYKTNKPAEINQILNANGKIGFELVSFVEAEGIMKGGREWVAVFKRKKIVPGTP